MKPNSMVYSKNGEVGELILAGDHVVEEYLGDKKFTLENDKINIDGKVWHRTGDAAIDNNNDLHMSEFKKQNKIKRNLVFPTTY